VPNLVFLAADKLTYIGQIRITACAVATSCCISDVSSEWERAIFDPP